MSKIRSKNTKPEVLLRTSLFRAGLRYRLHIKELPGKPDVAFIKQKIALFVHGCFWHQHSGCREGRLPKTRTDYWAPKLTKNIERDLKHVEKLKEMGWDVLTVWECEIESNLSEVTNMIIKKVVSREI